MLSSSGLDLLQCLLAYDPSKRLTARYSFHLYLYLEIGHVSLYKYRYIDHIRVKGSHMSQRHHINRYVIETTFPPSLCPLQGGPGA